MITPQEIQNRKFEKAVFGGYDMGGIDEFLDELIPDYTALYKETMTLKNKMKILVDKIEEYRSVDEEMRKALYSAQVAAKETVQKAQAQAGQALAQAQAEAARIIDGARAEADGRVADMKQAIVAEEMRLHEAKTAASEYAATMIDILQRNITVIEKIAEKPQTDYISVAEPKEDPSMEFEFEVEMPRMPQPLSAEDISTGDDETDTRVFGDMPSAQDEQTESESAESRDGDDEQPKVSRFKFENLKFGREYDQNDDLKD